MVDKDQTSPSELRSWEISADPKTGACPEDFVGVMLWMDADGWLDSLEVLDVAETHGEVSFLPQPSWCEPPRVERGPRTT
jgi:hypothetical protein